MKDFSIDECEVRTGSGSDRVIRLINPVATAPGSDLIHTAVIERRKGSNQRRFETHRARQQIARQDTPGALLTAHVADAGKIVNHDAQFTFAPDYVINDRR